MKSGAETVWENGSLGARPCGRPLNESGKRGELHSLFITEERRFFSQRGDVTAPSGCRACRV